MNKPMVKRDSLAQVIDGGPIEWARYHSQHRDLIGLNDWRIARRRISGDNLRDFLLKCAYFYACQHDWSIDQFAHECEIGMPTAIAFDRRMRGVYPTCAGLKHASQENREKTGRKKRYQESLLKGLEAIRNANKTF